ncbi:DUF4230 domain-containing protein [Clostridium ganghwense]|uniref:DUF4230 domain-containing protein n=1 Tax=Clostridium ganghwense TaxID=312089 RepID=A0ABT4CP92_9CLOT|nr:DUF4230 domain-containing protein [Clostridium ganghwense]MCY6369794.1 DUF4230 domain-containing protein [Clostridium ganghwense]
MKKWVKEIKVISLITVIIAATWILAGFGTTHEKVVSSTNVANELKRISELATYKNTYTDVIFVKDSKKIKDFTIPFTTKTLVIKYSGYVKAGVNLEDAEIDVNNKEKKVDVKLKKAKILDNVIDTNNVNILDERSALFNKVNGQEIFNELNKNKGQVVESLIKDGFLDKANENTKILLEGILKSMGFEKVNIQLI